MQTILASHDAVEVLAIGWGDLVALNSPQWIWLEAPIFSGLSALRPFACILGYLLITSEPLESFCLRSEFLRLEDLRA